MVPGSALLQLLYVSAVTAPILHVLGWGAEHTSCGQRSLVSQSVIVGFSMKRTEFVLSWELAGQD